MNRELAPSPPGRVWRGASLAVVAWFAVVFAHASASGTLPSVGALITSGGVAALIGIGLGGRRFSWLRAFGALVLLQPTLHLTLTALAAGHHHHSSGGVRSANAAMVAAHVLAAAIAAVLLTHGERALIRLVALLATVLRRRAAGALLPVGASGTVPARPQAPLLLQVELRWSLVRRGPPVATGASIT